MAERAGEPVERRRVGRQAVHLLLVDQLQAVLDGAQVHGRRRPVARRRGGRRSRRRPARRGRRGCSAIAARGRRAPCTSWRSCTGELDVADAAGTPLQLALARGRARRPRPRRGPSWSRTARMSSAVNGRVHSVRPAAAAKAAPSSASPATGRALSSAWNSHGSRPPLPVRLVTTRRCARARRRGPRGAGRGRRGSTGGRRRRRPGRARRSSVVADEHDVDVAGVVQLAAAELAHADDRQARARRRSVQAEPARRPAMRRRGRRRGGLERVEPDEVARRDARGLEPLPADQLVGVVGAAGRRARRGRSSTSTARRGRSR